MPHCSQCHQILSMSDLTGIYICTNKPCHNCGALYLPCPQCGDPHTMIDGTAHCARCHVSYTGAGG